MRKIASLISLLSIVMTLFVSCQNENSYPGGGSPEEPGNTNSIVRMISTDVDSLVGVSYGMQHNARAVTDADRVLALATQAINGDRIPLLFEDSRGRTVSIEIAQAFSFDHYLVCRVTGEIVYPVEITEETVTDYVEETDFVCPVTIEPIWSMCLIDLNSGKVKDISDTLIANFGSTIYVGYDDENLFFSTHYIGRTDRLVAVSKSNLDSGIYISPEMDNAHISLVLEDYVACENDKAYSKDNSKEYLKLEIPTGGYYSSSDDVMILEDEGKILRFNYAYPYNITGLNQVCYALLEFSQDEATFGNYNLLDTTDYGGILFDTGNLVCTASPEQIEGVVSPYDRTIVVKESSTPNFPVLADTNGNVLVSEKGYYTVIKTTDGYEIRFEEVDYTEFKNTYQAFVKMEGPEMYYWSKDKHINKVNFLNGSIEQSTYTVDTEFNSEYVSLFGDNLVYKDMVTSSDYEVKSVNIKDFQTAPVVVDYSISDGINIPDFTL